MWERLKSLFATANAPVGKSRDAEELHLSAAVLLVEAGRMDGTFDDEERRVVADLLARRFGLERGAVEMLIDDAVAEASEIVELSIHARNVRNRLSHDQRIELMEMLWQVVHADGELHDYEANLMRRIAGLLYVTDQESGAARKRALERLDSGADTE